MNEVFGEALPVRQRLAYTAAIHSVRRFPTIAITAQRWGLTLEEAGEAHAWALEALLHAARTQEISPWKHEATPQPTA